MLTVISSFHSENSQMGKLELLIIENVAIHSSWSHNSLNCLDSRYAQTNPSQMLLIYCCELWLALLEKGNQKERAACRALIWVNVHMMEP